MTRKRNLPGSSKRGNRAEQSFSNYPNGVPLSGILHVPLGKKVMLIENKDIWSFVDQSTFMMLLSLWKALGVRIVFSGQWHYCLSLIYLYKKKSDLGYSFMRSQAWCETLLSAIKQQLLRLWCSLPTNVRSSTVQKGVFGAEIEACWKALKCRRFSQSLCIPHWKSLWAFSPIFPICLCWLMLRA